MRRLVVLLLAMAWAQACIGAPASAPEEVSVDGRTVAVYVHAPFDPARATETRKVWHEIHAPDGRLLTKGLGGHFEHHRGMFFGHNQVRAGDRQFDFWHCTDGASQRHRGFVSPTAAGLAGEWQTAAIDWCDPQGDAIVSELRSLRASAIDDRTTRIDVDIVLRSAGEVVRLGGDPQHSGHQFRAIDAFAEDGAAPVRYVRPASAIAGKDDVWEGCDWVAAVLPLPDGPVTVVRVEGAGNPTPVRWSTRGYGRFGATFAHELLPDAPLHLRYAYFVALGELDAAACAALRDTVD